MLCALKTGATTFVLSCSVHSSVGCAPRVAVRPSLCSGPALPLFVGLLLVTLFRTRVYYKRKLIFFETVSELFEERKTDTRLQLCTVSCLNQNEHVLYTLRVTVGFFLTNVELSVQSQRVLWSSGRSVRAAALRARRRPNRSTTVSSNWKKRVCSVPRRKVNKANCFFFF